VNESVDAINSAKKLELQEQTKTKQLIGVVPSYSCLCPVA